MCVDAYGHVHICALIYWHAWHIPTGTSKFIILNKIDEGEEKYGTMIDPPRRAKSIVDIWKTTFGNVNLPGNIICTIYLLRRTQNQAHLLAVSDVSVS